MVIQYRMVLSMHVSIQHPLICIALIHNLTVCRCAVISGGRSIVLSTTGSGFFRVLFPFNIELSGPKILSAISKSLEVTGQL